MRLYNFRTSKEDLIPTSELDVMSDEQAMAYIPQNPVAQGCYELMRAKPNMTVAEVLFEILMVTLLSGGQRKFIHVRDGG